MYILLNLATKTFTNLQIYSMSEYLDPDFVAIVDVNNDHHLNITVAITPIPTILIFFLGMEMKLLRLFAIV